MKLDPIGRWQADEGRRLRWKDVVETEEFRDAVGAALLEFQADACGKPDGAIRIAGANAIVNRLCTMYQLPESPKPISYSLPFPEKGT